MIRVTAELGGGTYSKGERGKGGKEERGREREAFRSAGLDERLRVYFAKTRWFYFPQIFLRRLTLQFDLYHATFPVLNGTSRTHLTLLCIILYTMQ